MDCSINSGGQTVDIHRETGSRDQQTSGGHDVSFSEVTRPSGPDPIQLQASFYRGELIAAYLYLPCEHPRRSVRCQEAGHGLIVDIGADGRPIGIDISAPSLATAERINQVLASWGLPQVSERDLRPLKAA